MTIITNVDIPDAFQELFHEYTYKVFYGGRDSAKSYTFAQALLLKGSQQKLKILCVREFQSSIKDSVKSTLDEMIEIMDLDGFYRSTRDSIKGINGTEFIFAGIKLNATNIKSTNNVDICWVEEASTVSADSWEILLPTIRKQGCEIWISFNPYQGSDPVWTKFVENRMPNSFVKAVTFRDNPFTSDKSIAERAYDKHHDYDKYLHVWEGELLTITDAVVFKGKFRIDSFEAPDETAFYQGLDFGFSSDPIAFVRCFVDDEKRTLYIDKGQQKVGVEIDDTEKFLEKVIPGCKRWLTTADSARPELISHLRRRQFRIQSAKKGPDSVIEGIEFLKNYSIVIHESLKDVIHEFSTYSFKVDKLTGDVLPILEDKNNHFIDALRYAVERLRKPAPFIVVG